MVVLEALASRAYKQAAPGEMFRLSSGRASPVVIDASLVIRDARVVHALATMFDRELPHNFDVVAGPSSGADPLCAATIFIRNVRWCAIRKAPKDHGFDTGLVAGPIQKGDRVIIMEDVVTTGRTLINSIQAVENTSASIIACLALVDRREFGGRELVNVSLPPGVFFASFFTLADIEHYRLSYGL